MSSSKGNRPTRPYADVQRAAIKAVKYAVRRGLLPRLGKYGVETISCVDCSAVARCYDHRDYRKPLEVDPVCRSCNARRGPAIDIAEFVTRRFKRRAASI